MIDFRSGWNPQLAAAARARHAASGVRYMAVRDDAPIPPAASLAKFRLRVMNQGAVGTCHENAAAQCGEMYTGAFGYERWPLCRNLIGYGAKRLEGGGNPDDGAAVADDFLAMSADPRSGLGVCHESLWPYIADRAHTGAKPPAAALSEAKKYHFAGLIRPNSLDAIERLIAGNIAVGIGIVWPDNWGQTSETFTDTIASVNPYEGHAVVIGGYCHEGVWPGVLGKYSWYEIFNSWGELYAPLATNLANLIPGYASSSPGKTGDLWIRGDLLGAMLAEQGEMVAATGVEGFSLVDQPIPIPDNVLGDLIHAL